MTCERRDYYVEDTMMFVYFFVLRILPINVSACLDCFARSDACRRRVRSQG